MAKVDVDVSGVPGKGSSICNDEAFGLFLANEALRGMDQYVPMRDGYLSGSATAAPFEVAYDTAYARKIYYGSGLSFSKEKHPLACAQWDKAWAAAHMGDFCSAATAYLKRG